MRKTYLRAQSLVLVLSASLFGLPAMAQTSGGATQSDNGKSEPLSVLKYSKEGHIALRDIEAARLAIFSSHLKTAADLIDQAKADLAKAAQDTGAADRPTGSNSASSANASSGSAPKQLAMVPVDGQLTVADDFVATPEKQQHIDNANKSLKSGNHEEALKELRLGEIAVVYNRLWMPVARAERHLDQATDLMNEQKYYEANLALKAIGDSLTVESIALTDTPKKTESSKTTQ